MANTPETEETSQRLAKRIARAGLCSRRDAERWIEAGRVTVNGTQVTSPALNVGVEDVVVVDGTPLPAAEGPRLWRYHKPSGLVVTARDEKGRPTIFERLPREMPRVMTVGRLDLNSEGLLLLTNDGDLARKLELPATGWLRRYRVRVHGRVDAAKLESLADGVTVEGVRYGSIKAELEKQQGSNAWVTVALTEGKNREVRRVMEHLGYPVNRLIRTSYGPFQLGTMPRGVVEEVSAKVMRDLIGGESRKGQSKWAKAKPAKPRPGKPKSGGPKREFGKAAPGKAAPGKIGPTKAAPGKTGPAKASPSKGGSAKSAPARRPQGTLSLKKPSGTIRPSTKKGGPNADRRR